MRQKKAKKLVRGKFKCLNCHEPGHRKNSHMCPLNGTKKRQVLDISHFLSFRTYLIHLLMCRKRKPRKNTTKGWFTKETPNENVASSSAAAEDATTSSSPPSSPPRIQKKAVHKMTPKKKSADTSFLRYLILLLY
jgi:hypothetical protein